MGVYNFDDLEKLDEGQRFALLLAVGQVPGDKNAKIDPRSIEISLIVNGREVDFSRFADAFFAQMDYLATKRATGIVKAKFSRLGAALNKIEQTMNVQINELSVCTTPEYNADKVTELIRRVY